jgi:hypothetical protein
MSPRKLNTKVANLQIRSKALTRAITIAIIVIVSSTSLNSFANAANPSTIKLTVHYQRSGGDYSGWELWLWRNLINGTDSDVSQTGVKFTGTDAFGKFVTLDINNMDKFDNIGLIVRQGEWIAKDVENDRFITKFYSDGTTEIWLRQGDPTIYYQKPNGPAPIPAATQTAKPEKLKVLTISCVKGKTTKKVTGENPKCPSGFKNPLDSFLTFQAFSKCKLFRKDLSIAGIELIDSGKTLKISAAGVFSSGVNNAASLEDVLCALSVLKAPGFVQAQIETTRALDGLQKASWGKISAFWTYHPSNGLDISFNTK